ncbi:hypothetical protein ACFY2V_00075 [Streptomyces eurythermus]|uniref:hypothetical protein n=1 Tax=Streptomyces eurythermus TaxID=42237 RepID=UPI0036770576
MRDRTSGPGDDRHRTERLSRAPGEEWTPEQDSPATDEWSPGDAAPGRRTPGRLRPEERLPGEPGRAEGAGGWISGAGAGAPGAEAGRTGSAPGGTPDPAASGEAPAGGRTQDASGTGPAGGRTPDASAAGPAGGRLPGTAGPGREGLTGDDRTPEDTLAPPPGPAGAEEGGYGQAPADAAPSRGVAGAEAGEGFADRARVGREGAMGYDRPPEDIAASPSGPAGAEEAGYGQAPAAGASSRGVAGAEAGEGFADRARTGREGAMGYDRPPEETAASPSGPAGAEEAGYGQAPAAGAPSRGPAEGFADRARVGREGAMGYDRTPEDTAAPPPGPAGAGAGQWHGAEGLRPGTEELGADDGFGASHRAEREAISEEDRMPDNGLGAPAPGEASQRDAMTTDTPGRDTWPTAPGAPARDAPRSHTAPATGPVGTEPVAPVGAPAHTSTAAPSSTAQPAPSGHGSPLIAREEVEEWQRRMREVVQGFVDQPKGAVERADRTVEEIAARFSEAVTRRRRTLRMSWEGAEERESGAETDTEQLRLALRDYRELAERLLHT